MYFIASIVILLVSSISAQSDSAKAQAGDLCKTADAKFACVKDGSKSFAVKCGPPPEFKEEIKCSGTVGKVITSATHRGLFPYLQNTLFKNSGATTVNTTDSGNQSTSTTGSSTSSADEEDVKEGKGKCGAKTTGFFCFMSTKNKKAMAVQCSSGKVIEMPECDKAIGIVFKIGHPKLHQKLVDGFKKLEGTAANTTTTNATTTNTSTATPSADEEDVKEGTAKCGVHTTTYFCFMSTKNKKPMAVQCSSKKVIEFADCEKSIGYVRKTGATAKLFEELAAKFEAGLASTATTTASTPDTSPDGNRVKAACRLFANKGASYVCIQGATNDLRVGRCSDFKSAVFAKCVSKMNQTLPSDLEKEVQSLFT
jgi:hypothetical protein